MNVLFRFDSASWLADRVVGLASEGLSVRLCSEQEESGYLSALPEADVLWHILRPVTAEAIECAPKLKLIQKIGVGVNTIDLETAKKRGIAVCNMPGTNSRAVAELTLLLMLACLRRTVGFDTLTRAGQGWSWPLEWQGGLGEIGGRTVGLVGFGAVPRLLAPILTAMGAEIIYTGRRSYPDVHFPFVTKDELLARADIVSLHVPLGEGTHGWLDAASVAALKPGAIVVNVARGGLIAEAALVAALASGHLAAAGLDVFATEPAAAGNPLFALPNVVVSPHIAWLTRATFERSLTVAVENCRRLKAGEELLHRVA
ncbi:NAD(P)-dependent oxidoreductase [Mesorhizobium sp. IMUNJ 23232]|uniref:NAD(P)-dependent oxidoreductase n=1 Tax=Mesorhizobium sp. IMUNJ 23232 TaxID=3376064 RepID=UPI00378B8F62